MSKKPGKRRWSLTLLYSTAFFLIQLAAVLITAALSFLLTKLGVLDNLGIPRNSGFAMLIVMLLISVLVGSVVAIGTVKIPLRPFNRLINNIDRLAAGDFTARMHYGKVMGDNPVFQELSESFNAMAEELENTQMLRSDFINNFSHEFKTPIVSIAGFAKLLRRGNLTDAQKEEYLAIIEEESLRLAAMATNVMNLTKVENQTILTDLTTFNLSEQIRACVLLLEEKWSRKELDLDLEFPEYTIRANEEVRNRSGSICWTMPSSIPPTTGRSACGFPRGRRRWPSPSPTTAPISPRTRSAESGENSIRRTSPIPRRATASALPW